MDPLTMLNFLENYPSDYFGINYDTGNSASLAIAHLRKFLHIRLISLMFMLRTDCLTDLQSNWALEIQTTTTSFLSFHASCIQVTIYFKQRVMQWENIVNFWKYRLPLLLLSINNSLIKRINV